MVIGFKTLTFGWMSRMLEVMDLTNMAKKKEWGNVSQEVMTCFAVVFWEKRRVKNTIRSK